jgi:hypothetical protein
MMKLPVSNSDLEDIRETYGQKESQKASYPNFTRNDPISRIYRGVYRLQVLQKVKRESDPNSAFASIFLHEEN